MSGVTARTLRHYDEIGLLPPALIGANGHRYYREHQLLRLQQILVLRALGVGLPEVGRPREPVGPAHGTHLARQVTAGRGAARPHEHRSRTRPNAFRRAASSAPT